MVERNGRRRAASCTRRRDGGAMPLRAGTEFGRLSPPCRSRPPGLRWRSRDDRHAASATSGSSPAHDTRHRDPRRRHRPRVRRRRPQRIVEATGAPIEWEERQAGAEVFKQGTAVRRAAGDDRLDRTHARRAEGTARDAGRVRREERQRHAPQAVRDLRQHPPGARVPGRARRRTPAAASTWSSSARTSRTSTPASSTCRRRASPSA